MPPAAHQCPLSTATVGIGKTRIEELLAEMLELKTAQEAETLRRWEEEQKEQERLKAKQERSRQRKEARKKRAQAEAEARAMADAGAYIAQMQTLLKSINGLIDLHDTSAEDEPPSEQDVELVRKAQQAIEKIVMEHCSETVIRQSGATYEWIHEADDAFFGEEDGGDAGAGAGSIFGEQSVGSEANEAKQREMAIMDAWERTEARLADYLP